MEKDTNLEGEMDEASGLAAIAENMPTWTALQLLIEETERLGLYEWEFDNEPFKPLQIGSTTFSLNFRGNQVRIDFGDGLGPRYEPLDGLITGRITTGTTGPTGPTGPSGKVAWDVDYCKEYLRKEGRGLCQNE